MKLLTTKEKIIYIIIFTITIIIFSFYAYARFFQKSGASLVVIKQNGKIVKTLPIEENGEFIIKSELGQNKVTIKNGSVRVTNADCQDKICVKTAPLTRDNATTSVIVCLPHKLIISLEK